MSEVTKHAHQAHEAMKMGDLSGARVQAMNVGVLLARQHPTNPVQALREQLDPAGEWRKTLGHPEVLPKLLDQYKREGGRVMATEVARELVR